MKLAALYLLLAVCTVAGAETKLAPERLLKHQLALGLSEQLMGLGLVANARADEGPFEAEAVLAALIRVGTNEGPVAVELKRASAER